MGSRHRLCGLATASRILRATGRTRTNSISCAPGITILNVQSIKGQEFDTVFIMEVDDLLREAGEANKRKMYMLCARARDNLFLMHNGDRLPRAVIEQLPGANVLEWP